MVEMTERIDHAAEAREFLALARTIPSAEDETNPAAHLAILEAQAHATLALVEQQRIANLIALADARHLVLSKQVANGAALALVGHHEPSLTDWPQLTPDIAAALGIEVQS